MSSKSRIVARPHSRRSPLVGAALSLALPLSAAAADPQALSAEPAPRHGQKLDAVHIKDKAATPQVQRSASAKKADALIDTPQTVTVLKKETLAEQGVGSVTEALRNIPGITMQLGEGGVTSPGDTFQMRGTAAQTSLFVDGVRDLGGITRDAFNLEQLEVVKGASGSDIGRGAGVGYVNLVSKTAGRDSFQDVSASAGSDGRWRATLDAQGQVNERMSARLNVMSQQGDLPGRRGAKQETWGVAPALGFDLGRHTRLDVFSQHLRANNKPDAGVSTLGMPGFLVSPATSPLNTAAKVDPKTWYGLSSDFEDQRADMLTVRLSHHDHDGLKFTSTTRMGHSSIARVLSSPHAPAAALPGSDPASWTLRIVRQSNFQDNEIFAHQDVVQKTLALGGMQHRLVAGAEWLIERQSSPTVTGLGVLANAAGQLPADGISYAKVYQPGADALLLSYNLRKDGGFTLGKTETLAAFVLDSIDLSPDWQLNAGLRSERYKTRTETGSAAANGNVTRTALDARDTLSSWNLALTYKPAEHGRVYVAVANSLTPPGSGNFALSASATSANNPSMKPQETRSLELGSKWDLLDQRLSLTAAWYRADNQNEVVVVDSATNQYGQFGKRRAEGLELGAVGLLTKHWQVIAGVASTRTEVLQGLATGSSGVGAASRFTPKLSATLWTVFEQGDWQLGGGARHMGEQRRVTDLSVADAAANMAKIPSYTVVDAMVAYKVSRRTKLQLNLQNLTDRFYLQSLNNNGYRYQPGAPRSATLTLRTSL